MNAFDIENLPERKIARTIDAKKIRMHYLRSWLMMLIGALNVWLAADRFVLSIGGFLVLAACVSYGWTRRAELLRVSMRLRDYCPFRDDPDQYGEYHLLDR
ncbi:MAG TPA: hypothetical protein VIL74_08900 [Pyrinomonadaceae bacterium]|jgi:hypothetical protein